MADTRRSALVPVLLTLLALRASGSAQTGSNRWTDLGLPGRLPVFSIAVDPRPPLTIYAGTEGSGIFKTSDGGAHWAPANFGLLDFDVWSLAISPADPSTVFAFATTSSLSSGGPVTTGGLYRSVNSGLSWSKVLDHSGSALAIDPVSPSTIYAGGIDGLFKTADRGRTWEAAASGLGGAAVDALAVDPSVPSTLYAATTAGLFKSADGARSWTLLPGLPLTNINLVAIDPRRTSTIYAAVFNPGAHRPLPVLPSGSVVRSTDAGASWRDLYDTLPTPYGPSTPVVSGIAVDRLSGAGLFLGTEGAGIFRSFDGGSSWVPSNDGLTSLTVLALAVDPSTPLTLYAGTSTGLFQAAFSAGGSCSPSATALCLGDGRFRVEVSWSASNLGTSGSGQPIPLTSDTGGFWFFQPSNVELVVKVLDGRAINGHFWIFYGALSNVEYTITVTDTATGAVKTYRNPEGYLASVADTEGF